MKFIEGGPDIPDALLRAQRSGDLLFIVGAGVSKQAKLLLFDELADALYEKLGQALPNASATLATVAEIEAYRLKQIDRVIGLLEQRIVDRQAHWQKGPGAIRSLVADLLRPQRRSDLSAHLDLLDLSRGIDGRPRIVTTNFDTLFERAWKWRNKELLPSSVGAGMPAVGSPAFGGVLHIHGRIDDHSLGLPQTELVLTASNFGEAYMRNGWAARTIYDLLRRYTLVLVGYSADDPPMRYMLEASEEGRLNFPDLKPAYALAKMENAGAGATRELWKGKGLQPLIYENYSDLYATLSGWAAMSRNPLEWAKKAVEETASGSFEGSDQQAREQLGYIATEISNVRSMSDLVDDPQWLEAVDPDVSLDEFDHRMWFRKRLNSANAARYAIEASAARKIKIAAAVDNLLRFDDETKEPYASFWPLYVRAFGAVGHVSAGGSRKVGKVSINRIDHVVQSLMPQLKIRGSHAWFREGPPLEDPANIHDLAYFSFEARDHGWSRQLEKWPADALAEARLLGALDRALVDACELAREVGLLHANGDLGSMDLALVHAPEEGETWVDPADLHRRSWKANAPDRLNRHFAPLVRMMTGLWRRLANQDPAAAQRFARNWAEREEMIFRRLGAWAGILSGGPAAALTESYLARTSREAYWFGDRTPELVRFYCRRWNGLEKTTRARLEKVIIAGPDQAFIRQISRPGHRQYVKALYVTRELVRITAAGGRLSHATMVRLNMLQNRYPELPHTMPIFAHLVGGSWSGSGYSANVEALDGVPDDTLLEVAEQLETSNPIDQDDLWEVLSRDDPARAFAALLAARGKGQVKPQRWYRLFALYVYRDPFVDQTTLPPLADILSVATAMCDEDLRTLARTLAELLKAHAGKAREAIFPVLLALWFRLLPLVASVDDQGERIEPLYETARAHPIAILTQALIAMQSAFSRRVNSGFDPRLTPGFDALIALAGRSGLIARAALCDQLVFLGALSRRWTDAALFKPLLAGDDDALALLETVATCSVLHDVAIFNRLKQPILDALESEHTDGGVRENLSEFILTAAFNRIRGHDLHALSRVEIRRALTRMPDATLAAMAFNLWRLLAQTDDADRAGYWTGTVKPFLQDYWPNDVTARTEEVSAHLARIPAVAGSAFDDAVETMIGLMRPFALQEIRYGLDFEHESDPIVLHPGGVLRLLAAIVERAATPPSDLVSVLGKLLEARAELANEPAFWRLRQLQRPG